MKKIMFLCTGNSCRSQIAEGFARELGKGILEAHSAGLDPQGVNPRAVAVMREAGIDISGQRSKPINQEHLDGTDIAITLCDNAAESCPVTPSGIRRLHWSLKDPAKAEGSDEEIMDEFRKTRDEIRDRIQDFLKELN
jgi:arsenate reductase (thioredoxin)